MNPCENGLMWACYTTKPEAVSIRTTYAALRASLPNYVEMGLIRYIDYASARLPTMNLFEYIMHKDSYYASECEARAVASPPAVDELGLASFLENRFESETVPGFFGVRPSCRSCAVHPGRGAASQGHFSIRSEDYQPLSVERASSA